MSFVFEILSPLYLILSLIDQILVKTLKKYPTKRNKTAKSSHSFGVQFQQSFGCCSIVIVGFFAQIIENDSNYFYCYLQPGLYATLITYYSLSIKVLVVPIFLIIATYSLIRNYPDRQQSIVSIYLAIYKSHPNHSLIPSRDRETTIMLIKDMILYLTFNSLTSIFILYELITQNHPKDLEHIEIEHFVRYIGIFFAGLPFCIVFYTNLLVSKLYRQQVLRYFSLKWYCRCRHLQLTNRVHP